MNAASLFAFFTLPLAYGALLPCTDMAVVNKNISPDGFSRPAVLAEGTFPGPLLTGTKGGTFSVNVKNQLTDHTMNKTTSIHFHGIFQERTNYYDGASFVNQCPIVSGKSFQYKFSVPDQAGTFWYHSHLANQYCDGLRGPMVIYDPNDPQKSLYDVDDETTIITLADWYHIKAPDAPFVIFADSHLINGKGRYVGGPASPLSVMTVQPGKRYRFRLVAMSCEANYVFSVDGHPLTIIEADGVNTKPLQVDSLQIFSGQRYSVVLNANQAVKNYWIRALPNNGPPGTSDGFNSAILRYSGAPNSDPTTVQVASTSPLRETDLHPLANTPAPGAPHIGGADIQLNLNLDFDYGAFKFTVNGKAYASPSVPVLLQILSGASTAQDLMPAGSVIDLPRNKVIEVTLPGGVPGGPHPFHLHGHSFSVVRSAGSSSYNYANPVIRDVVSTGDVGDNTTIRFVTNNPGPWFLHCHVNWHLENGMAVIFSENAQYFSRRDDPSSDTDSDAQRRRPPFDWQGLCPAYNALSSDQH